MNEIENEKMELKTNLQEQVKTQISTLTTKIPSYLDLTPEEKEIVDTYIAEIDLQNPQSIDEFGKQETEKIYEDLDMLIGTLKTHDTSIEEMFTQLMMSVEENSETQGKSFIELLKESPITAMKSLRNRAKRTIQEERYRRAKVLSNIDVIREKLENIRSELRTNAEKLEIMASSSVEQYRTTQYQIMALQEITRRIQEERMQESGIAERTFSEIDQSLQRMGVERKIARKMDNCRGVSINAATKAIMARLLAQHNEELASDYDQDLSSLLPELKGIMVITTANDSLIQGADIHNQFVGKINEMLKSESQRSKEAIRRVQEISQGSAIDIETAKVLTNDVLEVIQSLKSVQDAGRPTNEAFTEILDEFRKKVNRELDIKDDKKLEEKAIEEK